MSPADAPSGRGPDARARPRHPDTSPVVARPGSAARPRAGRHAVPGRGAAGPPTGAPRVVVTARKRSRGRRSRRFLARWGWRAYAIPLLAVATVVTLVDLVLSGTGTGGPFTASPAPSAASAAPRPPEPVAEPVAEPSAPPAARAEVDAAPSGAPETAAGAPGFVQQGAGTVTVVDGTSPVYGTGPLQRFVVEVEDGIEVDGPAFAAAVEETLGAPRSWGSGGRMSFQRVGRAEAQAGDYAFKVTLISPGSMERYCPGVGTGGYTSCRYGERAVVNLARWATAVPDYAGDIPTYRQYVVNHEVGHALGNGHRPCPGPGQPAPVMQQQTLGLEGCTKNAWPHP
ncbi:Protein of unknown function [Geodermatophilus pulveris]|uniref:DUF3152 domain-containing protein n=1 Tax=Geodermatophilus pulveris TaxID=1564159 RepID=A0A239B418_9ACTN|nr:DUF3152 domain-containing protein [Geodermatophilus pulveris]SNS02637.1 Protein of unknown function [Geodermatophilus pulveris]